MTKAWRSSFMQARAKAHSPKMKFDKDLFVSKDLKIHIKSPEHPFKTLCGLALKDVPYTTKAREATCKRCEQILKSYK